MLKFIGCALVTLSFTGIGTACALKLKGRVRELNQSIAMIATLCDRLRYTMEPVPALWEAVKHQPLLSDFPLLASYQTVFDAAQNFEENFDAALKHNRSNLTEQDKEILSTVGGVLGSCQSESQILSLEHAASLLEHQLIDAREYQHSHYKLYQTMGVLAGAAVCVVFI